MTMYHNTRNFTAYTVNKLRSPQNLYMLRNIASSGINKLNKVVILLCFCCTFVVFLLYLCCTFVKLLLCLYIFVLLL